MDRKTLKTTTMMGTVTLLMVGCGANKIEAPVTGGSIAPVAYEGQGYKILEPTSSTRAKINHNAFKMDQTVCDPFENHANPGFKSGISAELYWLDSQCARPDKVEDLIKAAHKSEKKLFFTDLFTPTRLFNKGFSTQTSDTVKDDQGNLLVEWFGLRFTSSLRLPPGYVDGDYELAILSDDGTIMNVTENGTKSQLIKNDLVTPTRMGCSSRFVNLAKDGGLDFELLYMQGPRYHIANVLMWRHSSKAPGAAGRDQECGQSGNNRYFDPDKGSAPQPAYNGLLDRGWQPVPKEAFVIKEEYNPCHEGTTPVISDFRVVEVTLTGAILAWNTDIPTTTQLRWRNTATGEVVTSETDNRLRTDHSIWLTDLKPDTTYSVDVLATSEDNGHAVSGPHLINTGGQ